MGLFGSIASVLPSRSAEDSFSYRCASCGSEFDMPKTRMVGVRCPDCRSMDVRVADDQVNK